MHELEQKNYDINKIFKEALGYRKTFDILKELITLCNVDKIDYLTPAITNIIFSCELFIKLLIIYYNIKLEEHHNLYNLFKKLPKETQLEVEKNFNKQCLSKTYFLEALKLNSKSYTEFRYYFSYNKDMTIHMTFFEKFNDILFKKVESIL